MSDIEKAVDATLDLASENQRLRERVAEMEAQLSEAACGHPRVMLDRSVETGVEFCRACRESEHRRDAETMEVSLRIQRDAALAQVAVLREALKMTRDRLTTRGQLFDLAEFREKHALHFIDETLASTPAPKHDYSGLCAAPSCEGHCGYVHARGCEAVREYLADHGGDPYRAPSKAITTSPEPRAPPATPES